MIRKTGQRGCRSRTKVGVFLPANRSSFDSIQVQSRFHVIKTPTASLQRSVDRPSLSSFPTSSHSARTLPANRFRLLSLSLSLDPIHRPTVPLSYHEQTTPFPTPLSSPSFSRNRPPFPVSRVRILCLFLLSTSLISESPWYTVAGIWKCFEKNPQLLVQAREPVVTVDSWVYTNLLSAGLRVYPTCAKRIYPLVYLTYLQKALSTRCYVFVSRLSVRL